ncbi:pyrroline-5-carboxylate reductase [Enterococcus sp. PF1-24]|uniref:pyrroline-5-carboxylate reductase n=1 Tax=unclassified Enterococcus TaxID=2608891 RepID=UPI0024743B8B|nr:MULTISPECIES: pyrroline-5-carboxylate reductase [unclassified Enterococcus]MDH6365148.1 pyrroline-5-carboxylate reductase [Enterococcus sp. PFB1-1]MDH6402268.1 pyrroline-5-carboxylate reductase [Enterococcus sp. PF1-24]
MKLGFIGTGNMATAIIQAIVAKEFIKGSQLYLYDIHSEKLAELSATIASQTCASTKEVAEAVDFLILSVKPNMIETVLSEIKETITTKKVVVVSIAAGITLNRLAEFIGTEETPILRVMPNVNAMVGAGAAAVTGNLAVTKEQLTFIIDLFNTVGKAWEVAEKDFSAFTALAGSSPAYTYLFIDSLARAGVKHGLTKENALAYATQAVLGSAEMLQSSKENPWSLIDKVSSPGGTTVAGLLALEEEAFIATVVKGVDATIVRDEEMKKML